MKKKTLVGQWVSFEFAKDKHRIESSMIKWPSCVDWVKKKLFIGIIEELP